MVGPIQIGTNIHLGHLRDTTVAKLLTLKCSGSAVAVLFGKLFKRLPDDEYDIQYVASRSLKLASLVCALISRSSQCVA